MAPELSFDASNHVQNILDSLRRDNAKLEAYISFDRAKAKEHLRKQGNMLGAEPTDADMDKALDMFVSEQNKFQAPSPGAAAKLANAYVNRARIGKRYGIPTGVAALAGLALWGGSAMVREAAIRLSEHNVESRIEQLAQEYGTIRTTQRETLQNQLIKQLPAHEQAQVRLDLQNADEKLQEVAKFTTRYTNGASAKGVTLENYGAVDKEAAVAKVALDYAKRSVDQAHTGLEKEAALSQERRSLDSIIGEVRRIPQLPKPLAQRAETIYTNGIGSVNVRSLAEAKEYRTRLEESRDQGREFGNIVPQAEGMYRTLAAIAADDEAKAAVEGLHARAQSAASALNVSQLRTTMQQYQDLSTKLNQEYKLNILGGDQRINNTNGGETFYLIVEGRDPSGNRVTQSLLNIERPGSPPDTVDVWDEGVPRDVFYQVRADKKARGVISSPLGYKKIGHLNPQLSYNGRALQRTGQVTRSQKIDEARERR